MVKDRILHWLLQVHRTKVLPSFLRRFAFNLALRLAPIGGAATSANAQHGSQVKLAFWDVALSPDAWADYGNVRSITGVGEDKTEIDSTDLNSFAMERIGGLADGKEVNILCVCNTVSLAQIEAQVNASPPSNFDLRLTFPAPLSVIRYFTLTPLGREIGTIQANSLIEVTYRGRISGAISSVASH